MDTRIEEIGILSASDGQILLHMWQVDVPAGARPLRRHSHLPFEITLVENGNGTYTVGDRLYTMEKGDIFVFSSNEQHCITDVGEDGLTIVNLQFEPRLLWGGFSDRFTEEHADFCFSHGNAFENRIACGAALPVRTLFVRLQSEFSQALEEYALSVRSYLNLILIELIREYGYTSGSGMSRQQLHALRRVLEYIDRHLTEELTLSVLADRAGMSPNYLSAVFHKISGITLWDYINTKRIDRAGRLLTQERELTVLNVATLCGFNNTANFNKVFKKITGITPSEYRAGGDVPY